MNLRDNISDYTEQEFLDFLHEIDRVNDQGSDKELSRLLLHFRAITEHPSGIDLLYRPQSPHDGEPEQVLNIVKAWRLKNGKPGFKGE